MSKLNIPHAQAELEKIFAIIPYNQETLNTICGAGWDSRMQFWHLRAIWQAQMEEVYRIPHSAMLDFVRVYSDFHIAMLNIEVTNNGQEVVFEKHSVLLDAAIRAFQQALSE